jgi:hypothetical protein
MSTLNVYNPVECIHFPKCVTFNKAHLIGRDVYYRQKSTLTHHFKAKRPIDVTLHILRSYFTLKFVTYSPCWKIFPKKVLDCTRNYVSKMSHFPENCEILIWAWRKTGIILDRSETKLNSSDNILWSCNTKFNRNPFSSFWNETRGRTDG